MSEDRTVKGGVCEEHERVRREGRGRVTMEMLRFGHLLRRGGGSEGLQYVKDIVDGGCESHESGSTPPIHDFGEGFVGVIRQMRVMDDNDEGDDTGKGRGFRGL